jgi:hypothetical protein
MKAATTMAIFLAALGMTVPRDDLLEAAAAAWTALRLHRIEADFVCSPERDEKGLEAAIFY